MAGLASQEIVLGTGDQPRPVWIGNDYSFVTILPATGTNQSLLYTGAPGYFINSFLTQVSQEATLAVAGTLKIIFEDSVFGVVAELWVALPATIKPNDVPVINSASSPGNFVWNNRNANSTLKVRLSTALATGSIRISFRGGVTNYLG